MVKLNYEDKTNLFNILARKAFVSIHMKLKSILYNIDLADIANVLNYNQPPDVLIFDVIEHLSQAGKDKYGHEVLGSFLNAVKAYVGVKDEHVIDDIITKYNLTTPTSAQLELSSQKRPKVEETKTTDSSNNQLLFPPDSKPYGLTYGEWTARWWQWVSSVPTKDNPTTDENCEKYAVGQNDPNVWFLTGTYGSTSAKRISTIPSGKAILSPIINAICSYGEYPALKTESELCACANSQIEYVTNMEAKVDGVKVENLERYRVQSPLFDVILPENNILEAEVSKTQAVSDGYWIFLEPLHPGTHYLYFSSETSLPNESILERIRTSVHPMSHMDKIPICENVGFVTNTSFELYLNKMETGRKYPFNFERSRYEVMKNEHGELELFEIMFKTEATYQLEVLRQG
jgi:hypothetical protein